MHKQALRTALGLAAVAGLTMTGAAAANADETTRHEGHGRTITVFNLDELNDSGAHGVGVVKLEGNEAEVRVYAFGVLEDQPHAQHFHIGGAGQCPTGDDDADGDGIISTAEGIPAYGAVGTSLTTTGDTSPASALAVDRFPTADHGMVRYDRTLTLSDDAADELRSGNAVLVVHGIDPNGSGSYDGDAPSSLDPSLPLEATAPAACGDQTVVVGGGSGLGLGLGLGIGIDLGFGRS
ncbi:hypothetical protein CLV30_110123 [Haloactinopolyspora alba]|uniref:CHRD domain-containing protein n=1 Tax=Haloactinopolyspora alba TaxID=648780 RepID=A0A2P8DZ29_9ACTN|nr:hypothetical protein [Haloactinopolyspora alba]PSL02470.1 hypothetical protein CLV30_110123 [Haloactinopolyspora alba]